MQTLPSIRSYGDYKSGNYGAHSLRVDIGSLSLYFSYETVIAFQDNAGLVVRENDWSTTTGKHLNWVDGGGEAKKKRLPSQAFEDALTAKLASYGLAK